MVGASVAFAYAFVLQHLGVWGWKLGRALYVVFIAWGSFSDSLVVGSEPQFERWSKQYVLSVAR